MIQWFPGHMAKAQKEITERLRVIDIVFELVDARIPYSSKNPIISDILKNKPKLMLLTKADMADSKITKEWVDVFQKEGYSVLEIDSISGFNINKIVKRSQEVLKDKIAKESAKGMKARPIRAMIVGIPNVGKSTLINTLVSKKVAQVGNKPGVTKAQQWVRINQNLELLDTPGVLWPKFEDQQVGMHLALTQAIKDEILNPIDLGEYLIDFLKRNYLNLFKNRYQLDGDEDKVEIARKVAKARGVINEDYYERALEIIINDFRSLRIGKITLDRVNKESA